RGERRRDRAALHSGLLLETRGIGPPTLRCYHGARRRVKPARATLGPMRRRLDELGAHMSIAGGLHRALERGWALDCGAVQIFLKNQRQWRARPMTDADVRAFHAARRQPGIRHVFAHASYLINLGAARADRDLHRHLPPFCRGLRRATRVGLPAGDRGVWRGGGLRPRARLPPERRQGAAWLGARPSRAHRAGTPRAGAVRASPDGPTVWSGAEGAGDPEGARAGRRPAQSRPPAIAQAPTALAARRTDRRSRAGFARAIDPGGRLRKGGEAPRRVN